MYDNFHFFFLLMFNLKMTNSLNNFTHNFSYPPSFDFVIAIEDVKNKTTLTAVWRLLNILRITHIEIDANTLFYILHVSSH